MNELKKQISDADSEAQKKASSYEKLVKGLEAYMEDDKIQAAIEVSGCKKSDFGTQEAKNLYTTISTVTEAQITQLTGQGKTAMYTSYDEAIAIFKDVLKLDKSNQEAMYQMGYCYQKKGNNKKAKTWYEKVIAADDTSSFATQAETRLEEIKNTQGE